MFEIDLDDERVDLEGHHLPLEADRSFVVVVVQVTRVGWLDPDIKCLCKLLNLACVHLE